MIALIPARKGSKRIPGKNMRLLGGEPLIAHTLRAAYDSECFTKVVVSSDWAELLEYAAGTFGAETIVRPPHLATDESLDVEWIRHALQTESYRSEHRWKAGSLGVKKYEDYAWINPEDFCLLRPTSPFRGPETIQRACALWRDIGEHYDSLRAVRRASEPGWKQWTSNALRGVEGLSVIEEFGLGKEQFMEEYLIEPLTSAAAKKHLHSMPTQSLAPCYIQTAALEIAWTKTILEKGTLAGDRVAGFLTEGLEALDLNTEDDWEEAERVLQNGG